MTRIVFYAALFLALAFIFAITVYYIVIQWADSQDHGPWAISRVCSDGSNSVEFWTEVLIGGIRIWAKQPQNAFTFYDKELAESVALENFGDCVRKP
jgi:hypothetical protein